MGSGRLASSDAYDGAQRLFDPGLSPSATFHRRKTLPGLDRPKSPQYCAGFLGGALTALPLEGPEFSLSGRFLSEAVDLGDLVPTHIIL